MSTRRFRQMFALEDVLGEVTDGKDIPEVEHVFYGRITDGRALAELAKQPYVTKMLQQQYQFKLDLGGNNADIKTTIRARKVNKDGFVLTRKTFVKGVVGVREKTIEVNEDVFQFIMHAAGEGLIKMRYTIKPDGWERALELDVFLDAQGKPTGYAKYDFEVPEDQPNFPVPSLPVTLLDLKHLNPFQATDEDAALLKAFMVAQSVQVSEEEKPLSGDEDPYKEEGEPEANKEPSQQEGGENKPDDQPQE